MRMPRCWVLHIGPGHRVNTCVEVRWCWLEQWRRRQVEAGHIILGVYREKLRSK